MIQLFIDSTQVGAAGAVKLRWCVPRDVLADARKRKEAVWLLLTVSAEGRGDHNYYQSRQMVQLNAGATFVSFKKAGINRVFAKVHYGNKRSAENELEKTEFGLNEAGGDWKDTSATVAASIAECEARLVEIGPAPEQPEPVEGVVPEPVVDPLAAERVQLNRRLHDLRTEIVPNVQLAETIRGVTLPIDVPADCFAKEWPQWLNRWLGYMKWNGRSLDECNRRRRALFSFTIQPVIVLVDMLIRLGVALFLMGLGSRNVNYFAVVRPVHFSLKDVYSTALTPFWLPDDHYENNTEIKESKFRWLLVPFCPSLIGFGSLWIGLSDWGHAHVRGLLAVILSGMLVSLLVCLAVAAVIGIFALIIINASALNPIAWLRYFFSGGSPELSEEDIERLECNGDCIPDDRKERKTIRLWYLDLKAKVCKPLQG